MAVKTVRESVYLFMLCLSCPLALRDIVHTPMAQYSLGWSDLRKNWPVKQKAKVDSGYMCVTCLWVCLQQVR